MVAQIAKAARANSCSVALFSQSNHVQISHCSGRIKIESWGKTEWGHQLELMDSRQLCKSSSACHPASPILCVSSS